MSALQDAAAAMVHATTHPLVIKAINAVEAGKATPTERALVDAIEAAVDFSKVQADAYAARQPASNPGPQQAGK